MSTLNLDKSAREVESRLNGATGIYFDETNDVMNKGEEGFANDGSNGL